MPGLTIDGEPSPGAPVATATGASAGAAGTLTKDPVAPRSMNIVSTFGRPATGSWLPRGGAVLVVVGLLLAYVFGSSQGRSGELTLGIVVAIGALSLNVLIGYTGQISLGHQAFIGIGAFTSAFVFSKLHQGFFIGLFAAAVIGAVQAVVLGLVALRVRGLYFGLITLAWGFVGENCIFRIRPFTNGGAGIDATRPSGFTTDRGFLGMAVLVLVTVLLVDWRLVSSKAGRALQAIRESPQVAANYGINVKAYTLFAFAVSGVYAGLAGALFASQTISVVSNAIDFQKIALPFLIVTVVGGLRRRGGIVVFAILFQISGGYLGDLANSIGIGFIKDNAGQYVSALSGLLAILTLVFQPNGLGTITAPIGAWLKGGPFSLHGAGGGPGAEGAADARP